VTIEGLKEVTFEDDSGRLWLRLIPVSAPIEEAAYGIPIGPPSLDGIALPTPQEFLVAVHNQLFHRRLFTPKDFRARRDEVTAAIAAALRLGPEKIQAVIEKE
jgi:hypothetical protein